MGEPLRKRVERLELRVSPPSQRIDLSALTDVEFEVYQAAVTERLAMAITAKESANLCALATMGASFPYPIRSEPSFDHPPYLRVLIGGTVAWLRWYGWPGYRPLGWELYLHVGADGALLRTDGTAVFAADPGGNR
jgi:hypothetical protein